MTPKQRYAALLSCFFIASVHAGNKTTAAICDVNQNRLVLWIIFFVFITGIVMFVVRIIIRRKTGRIVTEERQKLLLDNQLLETQLRVNRSLMSPHFVYNSLNSLQNFILGKDHIQANNYLVKFSKLMRGMLESNLSDMISLEVEMELTGRYLEIESLRFEEKFVYTVSAHSSLVPSAVYIPVMMVQPFVENAVWHALHKKEEEKILKITFAPLDERYILCTIEDNVADRKKTSLDEANNVTQATSFVIQRLELLNEIHRLNCYLRIENKPDSGGTIVKIALPLLKKA